MNLSIVFYIISLCILKCSPEFSPVIEIEQGVLRGITKKDIKGGDFYSFLSVPYARKPVGNLRFMIPVTGDKWDGILNATEDMPMCLQQDWFGNIVGQEDCLYLNIHTPQLVTKDLKPVMLFIHGGGFIQGHGRNELHGPEFLMPEGVVLVTINYRLGLFGFLNFENTKVGAFGNMGLKDQNMALRWVQKNIEKFGGDPNSVTIFGESAGGASVHFHMLSPMSQGLFHKVIAHSGSALNPWATIGQKNTGVHAARSLGYKDEGELQMLPFLQEASIEDIIKAQKNANFCIPIHEPFIGGPIIENIKEYVSFLSEDPATLISTKKFKTVPFMLGFTNNEGIMWDVIRHVTSQEPQDIPPEISIPYQFNITDQNVKAEMANKIRNLYYEDNISSSPRRLGRMELVGDAWLYWMILKSAKAHAKLKDQNPYLFMLSADTELNYFKRLHPITAKMEGASHVDDLGYLFKTKFTPDIKPGSPEWNTMEIVVKLWTNFAKYGNPTPTAEEFHVTWKPVEEGALNYMNIGNSGLNMETNPFHERMTFWDKLEEEYSRRTESKDDVHTEL